MQENIYLKVLRAWFQINGFKPRKGDTLHFTRKSESGWYKSQTLNPSVMIWHEGIQDWLDKGYVEEIKYEDMYEDWSVPVDWDSIDPAYIEQLRNN